MVNMHCCYQCKDRQPLCHSNCERYAAMKEIRNVMQEDRRNESIKNAHVLSAKVNFKKFHHMGKDKRK